MEKKEDRHYLKTVDGVMLPENTGIVEVIFLNSTENTVICYKP